MDIFLDTFEGLHSSVRRYDGPELGSHIDGFGAQY